MNLFDLEGTVTLNASGFFSEATLLGTEIDTLSTKVGALEKEVSAVNFSGMVDSVTFSAESAIVGGGIDTLAQKVTGLKTALSGVDFGSTVGSAAVSAITTMLTNLLIGDIKVSVVFPATEDVKADAQVVRDAFEGVLAADIAIPTPTFPDITTDPFATSIAEFGADLGTALESVCKWSIPQPSMPGVMQTRTKIQQFWNSVLAGLNLNAVANIHVNVGSVQAPSAPASGEWTGGGGANANSSSGGWFDQIGNFANGVGSWLENAAWAMDDYLTQNVSVPFQSLFKSGNQHSVQTVQSLSASGNSFSDLENAVYSALSRWATPVGGEEYAVIVSRQLAHGMRGKR